MLDDTHATGLPSFDDIAEEWMLLDDWEDRYRLLIDTGRRLPPMPEALKTEATRVRGCSASVWVYPTQDSAGRLHFAADSNAAITKGIIALILTIVDGREPARILAEDIPTRLAPFELAKQLSSNRTQGIPNMIALIHETAERLG